MSNTHPSHKTRVSMDASSYDEICELCGATDTAGSETLHLLCPGNLEYGANLHKSVNPLHPSHKIRSSDASTFDTICDVCGNTDASGEVGLSCPCPGPKSILGDLTVQLSATPQRRAEDISKHQGGKYLRKIISADSNHPVGGIAIDVYCVLKAFNVTCPGRQQAIKKLLMAGNRGKGNQLEDLWGAHAALQRAIQLQEAEEQH